MKPMCRGEGGVLGAWLPLPPQPPPGPQRCHPPGTARELPRGRYLKTVGPGVLLGAPRFLDPPASRSPSQTFGSGMDSLGEPPGLRSRWALGVNGADRPVSLPVPVLPQAGAGLVRRFWWACASSTAWWTRTVRPGRSAASRAAAASVSPQFCRPSWPRTPAGPAVRADPELGECSPASSHTKGFTAPCKAQA